MQARLQPSEFAYLLHSLGTNKVIGVSNSQLFPEEEHATDALLQQGLSALKEHGWLMPDGQGYRTHTGLVLLTAVVANPEIAIVLTRALPDGGKQSLSYYEEENIIVEQIFSSERHYLITQLDNFDTMVERLGQALSITSEAHPWPYLLSVESSPFESAMQQAISGNLMEL